MMRRERIPKTDGTTSMSTGHVSINSAGSQVRQGSDHEHNLRGEEHGTQKRQDHARVTSSGVESGELQSPAGHQEEPTSEAAVLLEAKGKLATKVKAQLDAVLNSRVVADVTDKKTDVELLSEEDEALYHRLFPEDREIERMKAVENAASVLQTSGGKAFRIKVPGGGNKRLCLTEDNHGFMVRAEPCRKGSSRQKWYWEGEKLKNLFSSSRCLGLTHRKHHIESQTESMMQLWASKAEAAAEDEAHGLHLTMRFHCNAENDSLAWVIDKKGRLTNAMNRQCMATSEDQDLKALVLPCDGDEPFWTKHPKEDASKSWLWGQQK
jgi:hypothetical protein